MDMPILLLYLAYFAVLVWRRGWGTWSFLMTATILLTVFVFLVENYFAPEQFDWKYFNSRGIGVLLQIFSFSVASSTVCLAAMTKSKSFAFMITDKVPTNLWVYNILVYWNFFALAIILFFGLLVWVSRLYFSWACVRSLQEVLLLCQFTNLVQCYPCPEIMFNGCRNVEHCLLHNSNNTFHCLSPIFMLDVQGAFCIFNYNIGLFTFIQVFAYVGGVYFFFRAVLNFCVYVFTAVSKLTFSYLQRETKHNINRFQSLTHSLVKRDYTGAGEDDEQKQELLKDMSSDEEPLHTRETQIQAVQD